MPSLQPNRITLRLCRPAAFKDILGLTEARTQERIVIGFRDLRRWAAARNLPKDHGIISYSCVIKYYQFIQAGRLTSQKVTEKVSELRFVFARIRNPIRRSCLPTSSSWPKCLKIVDSILLYYYYRLCIYRLYKVLSTWKALLSI